MGLGTSELEACECQSRWNEGTGESGTGTWRGQGHRAARNRETSVTAGSMETWGCQNWGGDRDKGRRGTKGDRTGVSEMERWGHSGAVR